MHDNLVKKWPIGQLRRGPRFRVVVPFRTRRPPKVNKSANCQKRRCDMSLLTWYWFAALMFLTISSALASGMPRCSAIICPRTELTSRAMLAASPQT